MKKLRTINMLQDFLDAEFAWRLKELANLKQLIRSSSVIHEKTVIRATIPLLYAHWEGFVKNASVAYVNFVSTQRKRYDELSSCFVAFGVKRLLSDLVGAQKASMHIAAVDFFLTKLGERADLTLKNAVVTESNLSSVVFANIATSVGISTTTYEARYNLIDVSLLQRRNSIAHGDYLDIGREDCAKLIDEVITMLRAYKNDIENSSISSAYLRQAKS